MKINHISKRGASGLSIYIITLSKYTITHLGSELSPYLIIRLISIPTWMSNYIHYKVWDDYLSNPKLQRLHRLSLGMDRLFHLTVYNGCNYLSMLGST